MENNIVLNQRNLTNITDDISKFNYDRNKLKSGIVHIGVGGFHRSHMAFYIHLLKKNIISLSGASVESDCEKEIEKYTMFLKSKMVYIRLL